MQLSYTPPTPLDYFASLVKSDGEFALFEAAVSLARMNTPSWIFRPFWMTLTSFWAGYAGACLTMPALCKSCAF